MFEGTNEKVLYICLIGITGSFALFVNEAIFTIGNIGIVSAAICAAMFTLFLAVVANLASEKIIVAIKEQKLHETDIMITQAAAKAAYSAIIELQQQKKN